MVDAQTTMLTSTLLRKLKSYCTTPLAHVIGISDSLQLLIIRSLEPISLTEQNFRPRTLTLCLETN